APTSVAKKTAPNPPQTPLLAWPLGQLALAGTVAGLARADASLTKGGCVGKFRKALRRLGDAQARTARRSGFGGSDARGCGRHDGCRCPLGECPVLEPSPAAAERAVDLQGELLVQPGQLRDRGRAVRRGGATRGDRGWFHRRHLRWSE